MSYNGWSNYETWNVKLWIDNEQGDYEYWREQVRDAWDRERHDKDDTVRSIADQLKNEHEQAMPSLQGTFADLLGTALSNVEWYEIAEAMVNDEELEEDEEEAETEA